MEYTSTVTIKGQITIPQEIRKQLEIKPNQKVGIFFSENNEIIVRPIEDFSKLIGSLKTKKTFTDKQIDERLKKAVIRRFKEKSKTE